MPEGPEIRRVADRLARVLEGHTVEQVRFGQPRLVRFGGVLSGSSVERIDTRGKALLIRFDIGLSLYAHNQLYGRWYLCRRGELPKTGRSLRVALHTTQHSALLYSASEIAVLSVEDEQTHPFLSRIGPDVLGDDLGWRRIAGRLDDSRFRNRSLASLYLDQGFIAGIGNYLRSEILFAARLDPALRPRELSRRERNELARQTLAVSRRAYETGGVTLTENKVRALRALGLQRREYRFGVFDRAGDPCLACGAIIERDVAGSRRIYRCPRCQPGRPG